MEQAYCFFHQKYRVYEFSSSESQKDDIEYAVGNYADSMSRELYGLLSGGDEAFLHEHSGFDADMRTALSILESSLDSGA